MGYSMGPAQLPGMMPPQGFMMGGMRQGRKIEPGDYRSLEEYRKAVAEEEARKNAFFDGIDQDRQTMMPPMMPFWMR